MNATRRCFVVATGATVAASLASCGSDSSPSSPTPAPTATPLSELRLPLMAVGETVAATANLVGTLVTPLAVTRPSELLVVAVSRICTHEGCTVALPSTAGATLDCPCHGSRFRADGQLVNGPANRPLGSFPARIEGSEVIVTTR